MLVMSMLACQFPLVVRNCNPISHLYPNMLQSIYHFFHHGVLLVLSLDFAFTLFFFWFLLRGIGILSFITNSAIANNSGG